MSMEVEVSPEEAYLRVEVIGQLSLSDANDAFVRVLEAIAEHRSRRALVDCTDLKGSFSTIERFQHSEFGAKQLLTFASRGVPLGVRFAYVVKAPIADPGKFGETVAMNRGVNVRVFDCFDDAIQWLGTSSANKPDTRGSQ